MALAPQVITPKRSNNNNNIKNGAAEWLEIIIRLDVFLDFNIHTVLRD